MNEIIQGHELGVIVTLFWMVILLSMYHLICFLRFVLTNFVRIISGEAKYPNQYEDPDNFGRH